LSARASAATLAVSALLSVATGSRARAAGAAFAAWIALVYLSDLGSMGLVLARNLGPDRVFILAFLNPVEQARVLGTLALTHRPEVLGVVGLYGQDHLGAFGLPAALAALIAWAIGAVLSGMAVFRKVVIP